MNFLNSLLSCFLYFILPCSAFGLTFIEFEPNELVDTKSLSQNISSQLNVTVSGKLALCSHEDRGHILIDVKGGIPPYEYTWNNKLETQNQYNLLAGTYSVNVRDKAGLEITERIVIQPPFPLLVELEDLNHTQCGSSGNGSAKIQVKLAREGEYSIKWSHGLENELEADNLLAGNYSVIVTDKSNCSTSLTFDIEEINPISLEMHSAIQVNCESGDLRAFVCVDISGGIAPYTINWSTGESNIKEISFEKGSEIEVIVKDNNGCEQTAKFRVDIPASEIAGKVEFQYRKLEINSESEVYIDEKILFESEISPEFIAWEWDFGDGTVGSVKDPVHVYRTSGTFEVILRAFDLFGCSTVKAATIAVKEHQYWLVLPNAFSPNRDGLNDNFNPLINGIADYQMDIFTKWGEHVYSKRGIDQEGWDGTSNGKLSPQGIYLYKVNYETERGKMEELSGSVTLLR